VANRAQKLTLGEMRAIGVRGLLVYCSDYHCSHSVAISADRWPQDVTLSDLEAQFVCQACGNRGDLRPDFNWHQNEKASGMNAPLGVGPDELAAPSWQENSKPIKRQLASSTRR